MARKVTTVQRLAAVAVLEQHEPRLTVMQRIAVVDAAAYWVESGGGDELAWALLEASCRSSTAAGRTYNALLTAVGRAREPTRRATPPKPRAASDADTASPGDTSGRDQPIPAVLVPPRPPTPSDNRKSLENR